MFSLSRLFFVLLVSGSLTFPVLQAADTAGDGILTVDSADSSVVQDAKRRLKAVCDEVESTDLSAQIVDIETMSDTELSSLRTDEYAHRNKPGSLMNAYKTYADTRAYLLGTCLGSNQGVINLSDTRIAEVKRILTAARLKEARYKKAWAVTQQRKITSEKSEYEKLKSTHAARAITTNELEPLHYTREALAQLQKEVQAKRAAIEAFEKRLESNDIYAIAHSMDGELKDAHLYEQQAAHLEQELERREAVLSEIENELKAEPVFDRDQSNQSFFDGSSELSLSAREAELARLEREKAHLEKRLMSGSSDFPAEEFKRVARGAHLLKAKIECYKQYKIDQAEQQRLAAEERQREDEARAQRQEEEQRRTEEEDRNRELQKEARKLQAKKDVQYSYYNVQKSTALRDFKEWQKEWQEASKPLIQRKAEYQAEAAKAKEFIRTFEEGLAQGTEYSSDDSIWGKVATQYKKLYENEAALENVSQQEEQLAREEAARKKNPDPDTPVIPALKSGNTPPDRSTSALTPPINPNKQNPAFQTSEKSEVTTSTKKLSIKNALSYIQAHPKLFIGLGVGTTAFTLIVTALWLDDRENKKKKTPEKSILYRLKHAFGFV